LRIGPQKISCLARVTLPLINRKPENRYPPPDVVGLWEEKPYGAGAAAVDRVGGGLVVGIEHITGVEDQKAGSGIGDGMAAAVERSRVCPARASLGHYPHPAAQQGPRRQSPRRLRCTRVEDKYQQRGKKSTFRGEPKAGEPPMLQRESPSVSRQVSTCTLDPSKWQHAANVREEKVQGRGESSKRIRTSLEESFSRKY
jgi:hypothetical protein